MPYFSKDDDQQDIAGYINKIKTLSTKIEEKISQKKDKNDSFIESLSVEELKDLRQVMHAAEYLLTKYRDKKDIKSFLEEFVGIIMYATNSVNTIKGELEDLVVSAEVALQQIHSIHEDVTHNLAFKTTQTRLDDFKMPLANPVSTHQVETYTLKTSSINLTNTARPIHTRDYLERTAVEI